MFKCLARCFGVLSTFDLNFVLMKVVFDESGFFLMHKDSFIKFVEFFTKPNGTSSLTTHMERICPSIQCGE